MENIDKKYSREDFDQKTVVTFDKFKNCTFENVDFPSIDFTGIEFNQCKFVNTCFRDSDIVCCTFDRCDIDILFFKCTIRGTRFEGGQFINCTFDYTDFQCVTFDKWNLNNISIHPVNNKILINDGCIQII